MITQLRLTNFKPFRDFTIDFSKRDVLVGPNNAGKSSAIQALRIIDLAARQYKRRRATTFDIDAARIPFSMRNARNLSAPEDEPTEIECSFDSGASVLIQITHPAAVTATIDAWVGDDDLISFMPPVGPVEDSERPLQRATVRDGANTHLAPRHFRNLWHHFPEQMNDFAAQLAQTWPGITLPLDEPNPEQSPGDGNLYMFYEEDRSQREIAWAGSGLQIWMQILTFLVKNSKASILVLDEPELFLHADVQRKIGVTAFEIPAHQVIIATHSVEIIDEVEPEQVVSIDHTLDRSHRLFDVGSVQEAVSKLGSTHNVQLSRLARTKRTLFVEGEDFKLLRRLGAVVGLAPWHEGEKFSVYPLGGFDNWKLLEGVDWTFTNILGERIRAFVILDRDYKTDQTVTDVRQRLRRHRVGIHIWDKKEIENYLLVPEAIAAVVMQSERQPQGQLSLHEVTAFVVTSLEDIAQELHDDTFAQMSSAYQEEYPVRPDRSRVTVAREFLALFNAAWQTTQNRLARISGKTALAHLNQRLQAEYRISVSAARIASAMRADRMEAELTTILTRIARFIDGPP